MKTCSKCGECKPATKDFFPSNCGRLRAQCKPCNAAAMREWVKNNPERAKQIEEKKYKKKKELGYFSTEDARVSRLVSKQKRREQDPLFYEKARASYAKWKENNLGELLQKRSENNKERLKNDPVYAASCRIRSRISSAIKRKGMVKSFSVSHAVGCSAQELAAHIESLFTDGMSWDRIGDIHIDHIIPLATAKTVEDVIRLNHYTNLRPLWAIDNLRKGAKLDYHL